MSHEKAFVEMEFGIFVFDGRLDLTEPGHLDHNERANHVAAERRGEVPELPRAQQAEH
jgi:hypothetical protein